MRSRTAELGVRLARGARAVLFGVGPADPVAASGALLAMLGAGLLATWLPTHRLSRIDPTDAMRVE